MSRDKDTFDLLSNEILQHTNLQTYTKCEDSEDSTESFLHLIHGTIVLPIDVLQFFDEPIHLFNSLTKEGLLILEAGNETVDFVQLTFPMGALLRLFHD
mmetsp:Transcript_14515/g.30508  ORF Transcript_14515/g.30508 Transcript_14515/m.30508 type:complete len:99 (-) Transcript_14515:298-594(-)